MIVPERFVVRVRYDAPLDVVCGLACGLATGLGAAMVRAEWRRVRAWWWSAPAGWAWPR